MTCDSVELTAFRSFIRLGKPLSDFILLRVKEPRAMTDKQLSSSLSPQLTTRVSISFCFHRDTSRVGYSSDPASVRVLEQQNQQPYRMIS